MPNTNTPFGFRTNMHQAGGVPARMQGYKIATGFAANIFNGDLVRSLVDTDQFLDKVLVGATVRVLGVFAGCQYQDAAGNTIFSQYWPASTTLLTGTFAQAWVYDDPFLELVAQMSTYAITDTNAEYDINLGSGSTVTGRSGAFIDQAVATNPKLRVLGLSPLGDTGVGGAVVGAFAKVRARIVNHERASALIAAF